MKIEAKFYGIVNKFNYPPEKSYVTITDIKTGEVRDANAVSEKLLEQGIDYDDCEFEAIIQRSDSGEIEIILRKLEPKPISPERIKEIIKEIYNRWTF